MDTEINKYTNLYDELQGKGYSEEVIMAMLQEVGKDGRVERMRGVDGRSNGNGNGDVPATSKQLGYLKKLGVEVTEGLTKKQASELIDVHAQGA